MARSDPSSRHNLERGGTPHPGHVLGKQAWTAPAVNRVLTPAQVSAIRAIMALFVEEDLANGVDPARRMYCDACGRHQPAPGFVQYDRYTLCNRCATEYEIAHARGIALSAGQFVRDKSFGEVAAHMLPPEQG